MQSVCGTDRFTVCRTQALLIVGYACNCTYKYIINLPELQCLLRKMQFNLRSQFGNIYLRNPGEEPEEQPEETVPVTIPEETEQPEASEIKFEVF